jgi:hypothetical protein
MIKRILISACLVPGALLLAPALMAQDTGNPRTEHGHPDFQGTYTFRTLTPLNRPPELANKATLTAEEVAEWEQFELRRQNRDLIIDSVGGAGYPPGVISYNNFWYERGTNALGDYRTSLIYDPPNGRRPELNEIGKQRRAERQQMLFESAGPEGRTTVDRCLVGFVAGPPIVPGGYNNNMQIVQTKDHVMILNEMVHAARIIPLADDRELKQLQWEGNSVAHWEGETLVIETKDFYHDYNEEGISEDAIVTERITRINEEMLEYDFTVEDPQSWDVPWSAKFPLQVSADPVYEYACHEGNHGLIGILAGWRRYESMGMNGDGTPLGTTGTVAADE